MTYRSLRPTRTFPRLGESFVVGGKLPSDPWWRAGRSQTKSRVK